VAYGTGFTALSPLVGGYIADVWGRRRVVIFSWVSVVSPFSKKTRLPSKADPDNASAQFRNGILTIRLPLGKESGKVRIA